MSNDKQLGLLFFVVIPVGAALLYWLHTLGGAYHVAALVIAVLFMAYCLSFSAVGDR